MTKQLVLVLNTSPLIVLLDELGMRNELEKLASLVSIVVPEPVMREYGRFIPDNLVVKAIQSSHNRVKGLGEGEQSMIELTMQIMKSNKNAVVYAVTDDGRARKICERLGIRVMGTLGLIELMKIKNVITKDRAIDTVRSITKTSLYVTSDLIEHLIAKLASQRA